MKSSNTLATMSDSEKIVRGKFGFENEIEKMGFFARLSQIVDCVFFSVYGILIIRLLLALLAGKSNSGLTQLFKNMTDLFFLPFTGIFPNLTAELGLTLVFPIIVAIFVYIFAYLAINSLLTNLANRELVVGD